VDICMKEYVKRAIEESNMAIKRSVATPAKKDLFELNKPSSVLEGNDKDLFHSTVAKLLYTAMRCRIDILLPVAFLSTRVSNPTIHDQTKLRRILEYLYGTVDLKLKLGADNLSNLQIWVDASFAVHPDMKSHTGGVMSFGRGAVFAKSSKQKLNTKSSTEAEVVGVSDYLPNPIWLKLFMEAQSYPVHTSILEQDNESAMKLEENGRKSAGQKSRHIHFSDSYNRLTSTRVSSNIFSLYSGTFCTRNVTKSPRELSVCNCLDI